jgi:hypothetical protein
MQTSAIYFDAPICAHAANAFPRNIRGEATSRDLKEWAEDALWRPKIPLLLPIFDFRGFAHTMHTPSRKGGARRTAAFEEYAHTLLRVQNAFLRPFLRFFAWESM